MTDQSFFERLQIDDSTTNEFYARFNDPLIHHVTNLLHIWAPSLISDVLDIVQETFLWIYSHNYPLNGSPHTSTIERWLFKTAERMTQNHIKHECRLRRNKRRLRPLPENCEVDVWDVGNNDRLIKQDKFAIPTSCLAIESRAETDVENAEMAEYCLNRLPECQREIMRLYYLKEMTAKEIAAQLGIPETTIVWQIRVAITTLKRCLT